MLTLEINNSYCQLKGFDKALWLKLCKELSYDPNPEAARFSRFGKAQVKYLIDTKGFFPTGLLTRVQKLLLGDDLVPTMTDLRKKPRTFDTIGKGSVGIKPYPDQIEAMVRALKMGRGGINMPTGSGKSVVIALIISRLHLRTLVVVPTLELKKQLSKDLSDRLRGRGAVTVENIDSPALQSLKNFDVLIIDEAHRSAAATYQKLNKTAWTGIYHRFFLTATYFRNQSNEHLLFEGIAGDLIFKLSHQDAVSKGYIVPTEAFYYDLPKVKVDGYTWSEVYGELVVNNEHRNNLIACVLGRLDAQDKATLCLVKEVAHGKILSALTGFPFVNGQDEESRDYIAQFNRGEIKTLIGTEGVISEGVDTKPCEYVLVTALGKAKSAFLQKIGRGVRRYPGKESCKVILFRDSSHKWTLQHFKEQCKILKEELGVIAERLEA